MQSHTSKNTSVNHNELPYLVKHIDWERFKGGRCLDYGSGKMNIKTYCFIAGSGVQYLPYDPYWLDDITNSKAMNLYPTVVICSNVLNVIDDDYEMERIHDYVRGLRIPYFIKIYEGNCSGIGKETKKDCWQRNELTINYKREDEIIYKGIITKPEYKRFII